MLRRGESSRITGSTWINASSFLCAVLFSTHPHIALVVLNAFIWGDAVAALVGIQFGKTKIGDKSLEGSIACLSLCLVLFFFVYPHLPLMPPQWSGFIPLPLTIAAYMCITLMELFPVRIKNVEINDNLTVPVVTGVLLVIGEKLIGL